MTAGCWPCAHLQGSRVVLHLSQPLSDLAVGHRAAQRVSCALQELQLLLMLLQGLCVAAYAGGSGFSPDRQPPRTTTINRVAPSPAPPHPAPPVSLSQPDRSRGRDTHHGWPRARPAGGRGQPPPAVVRPFESWPWLCSALRREEGRGSEPFAADQLTLGPVPGRPRVLTTELALQAHAPQRRRSRFPALPACRRGLPSRALGIQGSVVRVPGACWEM